MNTQEEGGVGSDTGAMDRFGTETVSQRVVAEIVDTLGVDVAAIEPLYEVVDPDALNNLFGPTSDGLRAGGRVVFTMAGCEVTVAESGTVEVTPMDDAGAEGSSVERDAGTASE